MSWQQSQLLWNSLSHPAAHTFNCQRLVMSQTSNYNKRGNEQENIVHLVHAIKSKKVTLPFMWSFQYKSAFTLVAILSKIRCSKWGSKISPILSCPLVPVTSYTGYKIIRNSSFTKFCPAQMTKLGVFCWFYVGVQLATLDTRNRQRTKSLNLNHKFMLFLEVISKSAWIQFGCFGHKYCRTNICKFGRYIWMFCQLHEIQL